MRFIIILCALLPSLVQAQQVNWATDVAPILYDHCVSCHRPNGPAHFSLIGYQNAVSYASSVVSAVEDKKMPPWRPDPTYRHYVGENTLSQDQVNTLKSWLQAGTPSGNLAAAPVEPMFSNTASQVPLDPDQVLTTPMHQINITSDEYRCFVIPNGLSSAKFLRGLEVIPGNHMAVHHVLVYEDGTGQARNLDNQTPEPGYVSFGGIGVNNPKLVGGWVPGSRSGLLPPQMGIKLNPNADLVVQMHYPVAANGMTDQSTLNLFFTPTTQGIREVTNFPILNHSPISLENYPLSIPANTTKTYHAKFTAQSTGSLITVAPHMHLLARNVVCYGVSPSGDTIPYIRINDWDFNWQGGYMFQQPVRIEAGTVLHAWVTYDNTAANPHNPSSPPQLVTQGEATTDEMLVVYFSFMAYQPGDENMVLDSTLLVSGVPLVEQNALFMAQVAPNPAQDEVRCTFQLSASADVQIEVINALGSVLLQHEIGQTLGQGDHECRINVSQLVAGKYYVRLRTGSGEQVVRFVKM